MYIQQFVMIRCFRPGLTPRLSILGDKLTQADAENEALRSALALLGDFVKDTNYEGPIQLITGSPTALSHFFNFSQHTT